MQPQAALKPPPRPLAVNHVALRVGGRPPPSRKRESSLPQESVGEESTLVRRVSLAPLAGTARLLGYSPREASAVGSGTLVTPNESPRVGSSRLPSRGQRTRNRIYCLR